MPAGGLTLVSRGVTLKLSLSVLGRPPRTGGLSLLGRASDAPAPDELCSRSCMQTSMVSQSVRDAVEDTARQHGEQGTDRSLWTTPKEGCSLAEGGCCPKSATGDKHGV